MKQSIPVQVAEYTMANKKDEEPTLPGESETSCNAKIILSAR
jgi:hypothetical protein